MLHCRQNRFKL